MTLGSSTGILASPVLPWECLVENNRNSSVGIREWWHTQYGSAVEASVDRRCGSGGSYAAAVLCGESESETGMNAGCHDARGKRGKRRKKARGYST